MAEGVAMADVECHYSALAVETARREALEIGDVMVLKTADGEPEGH